MPDLTTAAALDLAARALLGLALACVFVAVTRRRA